MFDTLGQGIIHDEWISRSVPLSLDILMFLTNHLQKDINTLFILIISNEVTKNLYVQILWSCCVFVPLLVCLIVVEYKYSWFSLNKLSHYITKWPFHSLNTQNSDLIFIIFISIVLSQFFRMCIVIDWTFFQIYVK